MCEWSSIDWKRLQEPRVILFAIHLSYGRPLYPLQAYPSNFAFQTSKRVPTMSLLYPLNERNHVTPPRVSQTDSVRENTRCLSRKCTFPTIPLESRGRLREPVIDLSRATDTLRTPGTERNGFWAHKLPNLTRCYTKQLLWLQSRESMDAANCGYCWRRVLRQTLNCSDLAVDVLSDRDNEAIS